MTKLDFYEEYLAHLLHDMRSPLVNTRNTSAMVRRELGLEKPNFKKVEQRLLDIEMHMETCLHKMDALRYRNAFDANSFNLKPMTGRDVLSIVKQVELLIRRKLSHHGAQTCLREDSELGGRRVVGDQAAIYSCLTNLAMNAAKFSIPGTDVTFSVCSRKPGINVGITNHTDKRHAENSDKWMEAGFTNDPHSTGFGLAMVSQICSSTGMKLSHKFSEVDGNETEVLVTTELLMPSEAD